MHEDFVHPKLERRFINKFSRCQASFSSCATVKYETAQYSCDIVAKVTHDLAALLHATSTMNLKSGGAVANTTLVILLIWLLVSPGKYELK